MFKKRTTFVLGAGASSEFGFPLGQGLAEQIGQKMKILDFRQITERQHWILSVVSQELGINAGDAFRAAGVIAKGIPFSNSIDFILSQHQDNRAVRLLRKLAIVDTILDAEASSSLKRCVEMNCASEASFNATWLWRFVVMLLQGVTAKTLMQAIDQVRFISFNYDRSLEVFLTHAISAALDIEVHEAAKPCERCR